MSIISSRIVRSKVVINAPFGSTSLVDVRTSQSIESVRGNATTFQFAFFTQPDDVICDLSSVESLNLKIQPGQIPNGITFVDKSIPAADLDLTTTAISWSAGNQCQAQFALSNAEMNLNPEGPKKVLWLVITAILSDGKEVTLAGGSFILHEDNNATAGSPPENPGTSITLEQADARYMLTQPLNLFSPPVDEVPPIYEEAIVFFAGGTTVTTAGYLQVVVTGGTPMVTVLVPVLVGDNAVAISEKIAAACEEESAISDFYIPIVSEPGVFSLRNQSAYEADESEFLTIVVTQDTAVLNHAPPASDHINGRSPIAGTAATRPGQFAIVNEASIYMCARVNPALWLGPIFPHPEA